MTKRPCIDCKTPTNATRCPTCERARDKTRGSAAARGYGAAHSRLRAAYQARMNAGETFPCACGCGQPVDPTCWDLGHDKQDRTRYIGPEVRAHNRDTSAERLPIR